MRISFDLDETLISYDEDFLIEPNPVPVFLRRWMTECLRLGTKALFLELKQRGWEIWIYTTSYRSESYIRFWLWWYNISLDGFINGQKHTEMIQNQNYAFQSSKYPPAWGIDIHVDDAEGVKLEGKKCGFQVIIINQKNINWTNKILLALENKTKNK